MRDYGKVHCTFWSSPTISKLSDDGRMLALYLLTCPHLTIAGVFRLPDGYAAEDLGWSPERVSKGFEELFANGFANRCGTTKWVWISRHLEWNKPENPNQWKSAGKTVALIPDEVCWKREFMRLWATLTGAKHVEESNPSETLSQPVAVTVAVTETAKASFVQSSDVPPDDPADEATTPTSTRQHAELAEATTAAIEAFNASRLTKRNGGLLAAVSGVGLEKRRAQIRRCLKVAKEIAELTMGRPVADAEFWTAYWQTVEDDPFHSGRQGGGAGHANWLPDFEFLTRPAVMQRLYDRVAA